LSKGFRKKEYSPFHGSAYRFMTNAENSLYKIAEMQAGQGLKKNKRC
jgi:hypothetical protein